MKKIVIASPAVNLFPDFCETLSQKTDRIVETIATSSEIPDAISLPAAELLIVDTRLEKVNIFGLLRDVLIANAMINIAVMSDIPEEDFHETMEGLGVLTQLPMTPGARDAEDLWKRHRTVKGFDAATP